MLGNCEAKMKSSTHKSIQIGAIDDFESSRLYVRQLEKKERKIERQHKISRFVEYNPAYGCCSWRNKEDLREDSYQLSWGIQVKW